MLQIWVYTTGSIHQEHTAPIWVPHGQQLLPGHLLLRGFLSTGYRSGPESDPAGVFHRPQPPSVQVHLLHCGLLHGLQRGTLLHCGTPWAAGGQPASPWSSPQAAGDFCSGAWSTSPPPSSLTLAPARLFLTPLTLPAAVWRSVFFPVLNMLSQRRKTASLIGSALVSSGALTKHGAASRSFSQKPPLWPPCYQNLAM